MSLMGLVPSAVGVGWKETAVFENEEFGCVFGARDVFLALVAGRGVMTHATGGVSGTKEPEQESEWASEQ